MQQKTINYLLFTIVIALLIIQNIFFSVVKAEESLCFQKEIVLDDKGSVYLKEFKGVVDTFKTYIELYVIDIDLENAEYEVVPAIPEQLETVETQAKKANALAAINAGFFDGSNGKTVSYVIIDGKMVGDPQLNTNLTSNKNIQEYLPLIYNRGELKVLNCNGKITYKINLRNKKYPNCTLVDSIQGGPLLVPSLDLEKEAFLAYKGSKKVRESANVTNPDARIGVGLTKNNHMKWVVLAAGFRNQEYFGLTIKQFSKLLKMLDIQSGLAFDGGSSTTLYYRQDETSGNIVIGDVTPEGERIVPKVKSVLLIKKKGK